MEDDRGSSSVERKKPKLQRFLGVDEDEVERILKEEQEELLRQKQAHSDSLVISDAIRDTSGLCIECVSNVFEVLCENCQEKLCRMCAASLHRSGNRRNHRMTRLSSFPDQDDDQPQKEGKKGKKEKEDEEEEEEEKPWYSSSSSSSNKNGKKPDFFDRWFGNSYYGGYERTLNIPLDQLPKLENVCKDQLSERYDPTLDFATRSKYIPLRLEGNERKRLRLLDSTLETLEYTHRIDSPALIGNPRRTFYQAQDICSLLSCIALGLNHSVGRDLLESRSYKDHAAFYASIFELGRRYKIVNPEKMRTNYGKLMYMLQDALTPELNQLLEFSCLAPIKTVYDFLESEGIADMLNDPLMEIATRAIMEDGKKTRQDIQKEVKQKNTAVKHLSETFAKKAKKADEEAVKHALYSIGDNNSFLAFSRDPVNRMIDYLHEYFDPKVPGEARFSLDICEGRDGSRLSHNHARQFHYVHQSLLLWSEIISDMFHLWYLADLDLLNVSVPYVLKETGQGHQRIQPAPNVDVAMRKILHRVQTRISEKSKWIGSSVIHLGDSNVPNALMFIDKYTQVSRILGPIVITIRKLDDLYKSDQMQLFIDSFGGVESLRKEILSDFFRFGFDGSGADNFYDAGSCIDGRLTSAWNWCSNLSSKRFYSIFKVLGFTGFDGEFQT